MLSAPTISKDQWLKRKRKSREKGVFNRERGRTGRCIFSANINYQFANINYQFANINYQFANINYQFANINYQFANINYQFANINYQFANIKRPIKNINYQKLFRGSVWGRQL